MTIARLALAATVLTAALAGACPASAQTTDQSGDRWRVRAGAQLVPDYPGADGNSVQPWVGVARAKAGEQFAFAASDQASSFALIQSGGFAAGPVGNLAGKRSRRETNNLLPVVKLTPELGGFAQFEGSGFRLRGEVRQGIGGHKGMIGVLSADLVTRDGDNWLFAVGPRATFTNGRFQRAYFGVPVAIPAAGLAAYRPGGGLQALGVAATANYALSPRWGLAGYAKYDRLTGDPKDSPVVRVLGDRNQLSGGVALTFTFGG